MKALYGKEMICARLDSFEAQSGNSPHSAATCWLPALLIQLYYQFLYLICVLKIPRKNNAKQNYVPATAGNNHN